MILYKNNYHPTFFSTPEFGIIDFFKPLFFEINERRRDPRILLLFNSLLEFDWTFKEKPKKFKPNPEYVKKFTLAQDLRNLYPDNPRSIKGLRIGSFEEEELKEWLSLGFRTKGSSPKNSEGFRCSKFIDPTLAVSVFNSRSRPSLDYYDKRRDGAALHRYWYGWPKAY